MKDKKIKRPACSIFLALSFFLFQHPAASEDNSGIGYHGAAFLRVSPAARQVAMGEAFTGAADDVNTFRYNVAGLANLRKIMLAANFHNWIQDTEQGELGIALPTQLGIFAFDLTYFNEGKIAVLDEFFQKTGNFASSDDMLLTAGYASYIRLAGYNLNMGGSVKMLRQNLVGELSTSFGTDVGLQYMVNPWAFGLTLQNISINKIKFDSYSSPLPTTLRFGTAFSKNLDSDLALTLDADAAWTTKEKLRYYLGGELVLSELLCLRAGYKIHSTEASKWSAGFGLNIPMAWLAKSQTRLDYSYSPLDDFEMKAHRFSLLFTFGVTQEVLPLGGRDWEAMQERLKAELEAAERARLSAEEAEAKYKNLAAEMARRLARVQEIAAESEGKIEVEPKSEKTILISLRINFDFDKANIRPDERPTMRQVGEILNTYPEAKVHISGHTDSVGPEEYNIRLSQRRIDSVMVFLATKENVSYDRFFMPVGYGELRPVEGNETSEGRFRNRRVEFLLFTFDSKPEMPDGSAIKSIQVVDGKSIKIVCNGKVKFETRQLSDPTRLIVDIPNIYLLTEQKEFELNIGPFQKARIGYHPDGKFSRVVFDLTREVKAEVNAVDNFILIKAD